MSGGKIVSLILPLMLMPQLLILAGKREVIRGRLENSVTKEAVSDAMVSGIKENRIIGYCFSDAMGHFELTTDADSLKITALGYEILSIPAQKAKGEKVLFLSPAKMILKPSSVSAQTVSVHGDTISYSAGAFRREEDRKLADILKRIPELTVTKSGGVLHNGSYINKFYIEGLDMFGSKYGVATNNLSADDISSIEVIRNHQPIKLLDKKQISNKSALNITLKQTSKGTWILNGDACAGAGKKYLFSGRLLLCRFFKERQNMMMLKSNNTGENISKELIGLPYFGQPGAYLIPEIGMDNGFNSRLSPIPQKMEVPEKYALDNISATGIINHLEKLTDSSFVRISVDFSFDKIKEIVGRDETVLFPNKNNLQIIEKGNSDDRIKYASGAVYYENNSSKHFLSEDFSISGQYRNYNSNINRREQKYFLPGFKIGNKLKYVAPMQKKGLITISNNTYLFRAPHSASFIKNNSATTQTLLSTRIENTFNASTYLRFRRFQLSLSAKQNFEYNGLESQLRGIKIKGLKYLSNLDAFFSKTTAEAGLRFGLKDFDIRFSASISFNAITAPSFKAMTYFSFSPMLNLKKRFGNSFEAASLLQIGQDEGDLSSLLGAAIMKDYRTIQSSDMLDKTTKFYASVSLSYSDIPSMLFIGLGGNILASRSNKSITYNYSNNYTIIGVNGLPADRKNYGLSFNLAKYFGARIFSMKISGDISRSVYDGFLQGMPCKSIANYGSCGLKLNLAPIKWLNIESEISYSINNIIKPSEAAMQNINLSGHLYIKPFNRFSIYGDILYSHMKFNESFSENMPLLDIGMEYSLKKAVLFATCRNILGYKTLYHNFSGMYETVSLSSGLRGREFLAGIRLDI